MAMADMNSGIDFTVHLPANAKLVAENDYGPLTIGDYKGEAELYCRYGTLTAGKLIQQQINHRRIWKSEN
jgi:hypothetical protein